MPNKNRLAELSAGNDEDSVDSPPEPIKKVMGATGMDPLIFTRDGKRIQRRLAGLSVPGYPHVIQPGLACANPLRPYDNLESVVISVTRLPGNVFHVERKDGTAFQFINAGVVAVYDLDPLEVPLDENEIRRLAMTMFRQKMKQQMMDDDFATLENVKPRAEYHDQLQRVEAVLKALVEHHEREVMRQELNGMTTLTGEPLVVTETDDSDDGPELVA